MSDVQRLARALAKLRASADAVAYVPHARQREFHAAGATVRERLFLAGNRVGKTLAGAAEMAFHLTGVYPDWWDGVRFDRPVRAWAASLTREVTRDILQRVYLGDGVSGGVIPPDAVERVTLLRGVAGAYDTVSVRHASGGISRLGFKSYDQGRAAFQGTARDVIHLDEEPDIGIYEECLLRTLTLRGHVMLTMTPLLGLTEVVRHFVDAERAAGKAVVKAGWADAAHLNDAAVAQMRKSLRPHEIAAREFGEPKLGSGAVFPINEQEICCDRFDIPTDWPCCIGMDFGWTNPTAAVWLALDRVRDVVYVVDIYRAAEMTPAEHAAAITARGKWGPIVCDPAGGQANQRDGVSLMSLYEQAGLRMEAADNSAEAGLMLMLERMRTGRLKVFEDLAGWWGEFRTYVRDEKGRIVKRNDHLMDATRYALVSGIPLARPRDGTRDLRREKPVDWRRI